MVWSQRLPGILASSWGCMGKIPIRPSYFQAQFTRHSHFDLILFIEHLLCAEYPLGTGETAGTKTDIGLARGELRVRGVGARQCRGGCVKTGDELWRGLVGTAARQRHRTQWLRTVHLKMATKINFMFSIFYHDFFKFCKIKGGGEDIREQKVLPEGMAAGRCSGGQEGPPGRDANRPGQQRPAGEGARERRRSRWRQRQRRGPRLETQTLRQFPGGGWSQEMPRG